nr:hypothetical protein [Tanacetum cinerariifolium]
RGNGEGSWCEVQRQAAGAAAEAAPRFEEQHVRARVPQPPGGGDAGRPAANDDGAARPFNHGYAAASSRFSPARRIIAF